jgi:hypothetical protein
MAKERKAWESIVGRTFGRLTVESEIGETAVCRCSCGKLHMTDKRRLPTGNTASCGCLRKELTAITGRTKKQRKLKWIATLRSVSEL